jgi:hypothetical protein
MNPTKLFFFLFIKNHSKMLLTAKRLFEKAFHRVYYSVDCLWPGQQKKKKFITALNKIARVVLQKHKFLLVRKYNCYKPAVFRWPIHVFSVNKSSISKNNLIIKNKVTYCRLRAAVFAKAYLLQINTINTAILALRPVTSKELKFQI